jgi:hypothetical protein
MTLHILQVGQVWEDNDRLGRYFLITSIVEGTAFCDDSIGINNIFCTYMIDGGFRDRSNNWHLVDPTKFKPKKPEKVIPGMPLDPTLPILQAGYLQDRQRKQYKFK